jgi:hypothetical protein
MVLSDLQDIFHIIVKKLKRDRVSIYGGGL